MHSQYPVISIIVPVFNVEKYLASCIDSILSQSYKNMEIILVNDGSADRSLDICRNYCEVDDRIVLVDKSNGGVNSARKEGARICKGEYVLCIDADDWIETDTLECLLNLKPRADIYAFCYYEEGSGYRGIKKNVTAEGMYTGGEKLKDFYANMLMDERVFDQGVFSSLCNKMIRRDIYVKNQLSVPDGIYYGEDTACTFPCLLDADSVWVTNMPLYHYRLRSDSCVRSTEVSLDNFQQLFSFLDCRFTASVYKEILDKQLKLFLWQALLLKAYDKINSDMALFPFGKVKFGMRVAVYGAGLFGQVIANYCCRSENLTVAGWFDRRHNVYYCQGLSVLPSADVLSTDFDVMVIAILNACTAEYIKQDYMRQGIAEHKIDTVSMELLKSADVRKVLLVTGGEYQNV